MVRFQSTRSAESASIDDALLRGIAADGGLYVPARLQQFEISDFDGRDSAAEIARTVLTPYFQASTLVDDLDEIIAETFSFPLPVSALDDGLSLLELFHGPTAAFKDVGAGFLAACISRLDRGQASPLNILVATSGDTGGAVAAAFDRRTNIRVAVLYPDGRVSERQAQQLTCWSDNVISLAVQGSFDDCQAVVKETMGDANARARHRFSSANSINIGRLLPQCIYYALSSLGHWRKTGQPANFIVPTGNLGNAVACVLMRSSGLPIDDIVLATNANRVIPDFLNGADWEARASLQTLASAMDVGNPSNMERLRWQVGDAEALRAQVTAVFADDEAITRQIADVFEQYGVIVCPHTATAFHAYQNLPTEKRSKDWILVATAHPAKFESIVEPIIGQTVPVPQSLAELLDRPSRFTRIQPNVEELLAQLDGDSATGDK